MIPQYRNKSWTRGQAGNNHSGPGGPAAARPAARAFAKELQNIGSVADLQWSPTPQVQQGLDIARYRRLGGTGRSQPKACLIPSCHPSMRAGGWGLLEGSGKGA
eukprot:gene21733-28754_t